MAKKQVLREIFSNNLRYYRTNHIPKITQEKLSEMVGKNQNYIGLLETGKTSAPLDMIELIARQLGIEPHKLLEASASPENVQQFSKEEFIERVTNDLHARLVADIRREMREVLAGK